MTRTARLLLIGLVLAGAGLAGAGLAQAQSRLKTMPGYEQWEKVGAKISGALKSGAIQARWDENSRRFEYTQGGELWTFDVARLTATSQGPAEMPRRMPAAAGPAHDSGLVLARGRGGDADTRSPNGLWRVVSRDMNVYLISVVDGTEKPLSTDGGPAARIRHGVGSYVYLEEFSVRSPVWWAPDSSKVAWMRYDESKVEDYFLQLDQTKTLSTVHTQAYPHPGTANPVADLIVYDVATGKTTRMDVREGKPFTDDVVGHYVWGAEWSRDATQILTRRADRLQKVYDLAACDPVSGACKTVVRESRPDAWASGAAPSFLRDGKRFIWRSDRTDFANYYLYNLDGKLLATLTKHDFDVGDIVKVDEKAGYLWYMARSGDNFMKMQLHRVKLDGRDDRRITDPKFHHRVTLSPDSKFIVDVAQTHNSPPVSRLLDGSGAVLSQIALSDLGEYDALGLKRSEVFTFTSADGKTPLHGIVDFPSTFDPAKKYPVLLSVYGGPGSNGVAETFATPSSLTEYGFIVVRLDARTAAGKGRKVLDTVYQQLGIAEMDDFAAGIRELTKRAYVDANRVGVYGTSYGGTVSATLLMRYPDLFQAAVSNSPVTDYRLYDTAYTERFLGLPQASPKAYDQSAVLTYVDGLKGDLLLYYGTSDDNVHPKNTLQLIKALQQAGKSFEVQVGPDRGHTSVNQDRMMEFFIQKLVIDRP